MEQTGQTLTLTGAARYRGNSTHNGNLLKIHDNSFTTSFSKLTPAATVTPEFGFGVYADPTAKNNAVTTVKGAGFIPAGVLIRNPAIASGYPMAPNSVDDWNKADRAIDGYVEYSSAYDALGVLNMSITDIEIGMKLCINDLNGQPHFAAAAPVGFTAFGTVVLVNPDSKKWTVKLAIF